MAQNIGAATVSFTAEELDEIDAQVAAVRIEGARLPEPILKATGVEAPDKA